MAAGPQKRIFAEDLLAGRHALVTGGGTGLGRAIAQALAEAGADLMLAARQVERLDKAAEEIRGSTGRRVETSFVNIRDRAAVEALRDVAKGVYGGIDILVNNAGGQFPQAARDFKLKGWNAVIETNLTGTWNMTQVFGNEMLDNAGGVITQIIAVIGRGFPGIAHTAAARAGVAELARTLAYEWGPKVRINCIAPGGTRTQGFDETYNAGVIDQLEQQRIPRPITPEAVANAAVFLSSSAAEYVTGEVLFVADGGQAYGKNQALLDHDLRS